MRTLEHTWTLFRQSLAAIVDDTGILLFPVMSAISALLIGVAFFYPLYESGTLAAIANRQAKLDDYYLMVLVWYCANYFVIIFFNTALVACAYLRLEGEEPTVMDGLSIAVSRIGRIVQWAVLSATVGVLLGCFRRRRGFMARTFGPGIGLTWTLTTYLIIPVIVVEDLSVGTAFTRSARLFRNNWGEELTGSFAFGFLTFLACLPALLIGSLVYQYDRLFALILTGVCLIVPLALCSAVKGVFGVALYRYTRFNRLPDGFGGKVIDGALQSRRLVKGWEEADSLPA